MIEQIGYYIFCIVAIAVTLFLIKKIVSCLIRSIIMGIVIAILVIVYLTYFYQG